MAFTPNQSIEDFVLVSVKDPAIDKDESDLDSYEKDADYNLRNLAFLSGREPTRFLARPLSRRIATRILDMMIANEEKAEIGKGFNQAGFEAFKHGVYDIENLEGFDKTRHLTNGNPPILKEAWLEFAPLPLQVIVEIGAVILAKSRLLEADRKN